MSGGEGCIMGYWIAILPEEYDRARTALEATGIPWREATATDIVFTYAHLSAELAGEQE